MIWSSFFVSNLLEAIDIIFVTDLKYSMLEIKRKCTG